MPAILSWRAIQAALLAASILWTIEPIGSQTPAPAPTNALAIQNPTEDLRVDFVLP